MGVMKLSQLFAVAVFYCSKDDLLNYGKIDCHILWMETD